MDSNTTTDIGGPLYEAPVCSKRFWIIPWPLAYNRLELDCIRKNIQFLIHFWMKMKSFRDYLGLSNSCSYNVDDVIGRADRFGFQNFCSPGAQIILLVLSCSGWSNISSIVLTYRISKLLWVEYFLGIICIPLARFSWLHLRQSNPSGGEILPKPKRRFIAQRLSCSPFRHSDMTEILLKGT